LRGAAGHQHYFFTCATLLNSELASAEQWLALTLAPDGTWGAAAEGVIDIVSAGSGRLHLLYQMTVTTA
jgi:hypothetical protein